VSVPSSSGCLEQPRSAMTEHHDRHTMERMRELPVLVSKFLPWGVGAQTRTPYVCIHDDSS
jgi:hypothetical protein